MQLDLSGHHVEVTANVASLQEVEQALSLGGEGVGLLRRFLDQWLRFAMKLVRFAR